MVKAHIHPCIGEPLLNARIVHLALHLPHQLYRRWEADTPVLFPPHRLRLTPQLEPVHRLGLLLGDPSKRRTGLNLQLVGQSPPTRKLDPRVKPGYLRQLRIHRRQYRQSHLIMHLLLVVMRCPQPVAMQLVADTTVTTMMVYPIYWTVQGLLLIHLSRSLVLLILLPRHVSRVTLQPCPQLS